MTPFIPQWSNPGFWPAPAFSLRTRRLPDAPGLQGKTYCPGICQEGGSQSGFWSALSEFQNRRSPCALVSRTPPVVLEKTRKLSPVCTAK